jgi:hypothetical protein
MDIWVAQHGVRVEGWKGSSLHVGPRKMAPGWTARASLARCRQSDHLVLHMEPTSLAASAKVVVWASEALVAWSKDRTFAAITGHPRVNLITP